MDIKHREVVQWLEEVYGSDQIPPYEKTERSINILHQLMTVSKKSEKNAKLLAADYATKTSEYNAECRQVDQWLKSVYVNPSKLLKGQKGLSAFANAAQVLDVQIPTSTNIILAANQLEVEHMQTVNELEQEKGRMSQLLELSKDVAMKIEEIRSIHKQAEATWNQQQECLVKDKKQEYYVEEKRKDYLSDINYYEAKLSHVGMTKNIMHSALCKQWKELQDLEKQMSSLEMKLKSYDLPPDMTLAQVKVEEARQKLAALMSDVAAACKEPLY